MDNLSEKNVILKLELEQGSLDFALKIYEYFKQGKVVRDNRGRLIILFDKKEESKLEVICFSLICMTKNGSYSTKIKKSVLTHWDSCNEEVYYNLPEQLVNLFGIIIENDIIKSAKEGATDLNTVNPPSLDFLDKEFDKNSFPKFFTKSDQMHQLLYS